MKSFIDLVIEKGNESIAVEIKTGTSDWRKNVEKNVKKGFEAVYIIVTKQELQLKFQEVASIQWPETIILIKQCYDLI